MKKILLLFTAVGFFSLTGCNNDDDRVDNDTIAEVFEVDNVDFSSANLVNSITIPLNPTIFTSDVVLVYRLSGTDNGDDVWEPLPSTYNFTDGGTLQYYFDFSIRSVVVYLESNFNTSNETGYTQNQVFRVVIVPGYFSKGTAKVDYKDYNAVMTAYGLTEKDVKTLSVKK